ncbi:MAG TPA: EF-hand domain-containing protein [candidate division Zixibacteria bacterium]|nr:EF-hand domain-containing protein [candidate division Zixibacteria bacterium]
MVDGIQGNMGISSDMMTQMREKMFERMDSDGDGQIDLAQLQSEAEQAGQVDDRFEAMLEHLTEADTDGDGMVSQAEFEAMEPPPPPPPPEDMSDMAMSMYSESAEVTEDSTLTGYLLDQLC